MRGMDTITSHGLHYFKLTFHRPFINSSAKTPQVMMITNSFYLYLFAVKRESLIMIKIKKAYAKGSPEIIINPAVAFDL